ncbi:hypothetical protein AVEN_107998-1 [Araneus ventricosus]|uniref:Uncharacterized protein n=1 Tax=Araneus ventricosus TaxID=182803 RepID=A0A4Y2DUM8_ARAVE|nr:hypothetical protein AVEN_107998-1 [Araneus ventricosus]
MRAIKRKKLVKQLTRCMKTNQPSFDSTRNFDQTWHFTQCTKDSIYLCPPFVEEGMNMNTELLNDTLGEIFEETDSEDYNENESESEMEELEIEVSEDTERWADDGD